MIDGPVRVLLIDDNPDDYLLTRDLLADIPAPKFELDWASRFDQAVEDLAANGHHIYLLRSRLGTRPDAERGLAEEMAELLVAERRQTRSLRRLAEAALRVNAATTPAEVLGVLTEQARALVPCGYAVGSLTPNGDPSQAVQGASGVEAAGDDGSLAVPLVGRDGRELGRLRVAGREGGAFTDEDEAVLAQLALLAAGAVENARLVAELRETDRRKDEFLAMLAHELRNPLATIRNTLNQARLRDDGTVPAAELGRMGRQADHLMRAADDLLDVSRATRGKIRLRKERLDLAAVILAAADEARPSFEERGQQFTLSLPDAALPIEADAVRLTQVFANLLANAAHYTPPGGRITLTAERDGGTAAVRVRDDGRGIPRELLGSVFEMFFQAERTAERPNGGLGIGLTLAKGLTELHGGTVEARSDGPGRGSEFVVRLPLRAAGGVGEPVRQPADEAAPAADVSHRILVVDDNHDSAESLATLLRLMGNDVRTAHDGPEGLSLAEGYQPDLILLDISMPGMSGHEVARRLRTTPAGGRATLVALTGLGSEGDRQKSRAAGFNAHLTKPLDLDALQEILVHPAVGTAGPVAGVG